MDATAVMSGLVEIIKAGGPLALWGIGIWLIFGIIKVSVLCLAVWGVVKLICQTITVNYRISKELSAQRIHLLSKEVSERFQTSLDKFSQDLSSVVKECKTALDSLKSQSKEK